MGDLWDFLFQNSTRVDPLVFVSVAFIAAGTQIYSIRRRTTRPFPSLATVLQRSINEIEDWLERLMNQRVQIVDPVTGDKLIGIVADEEHFLQAFLALADFLDIRHHQNLEAFMYVRRFLTPRERGRLNRRKAKVESKKKRALAKLKALDKYDPAADEKKSSKALVRSLKAISDYMESVIMFEEELLSSMQISLEEYVERSMAM